MYMNAFDLYERLTKAVNNFNNLRGLKTSLYGATVEGDSFGLTSPCTLYAHFPVPGKRSDDFKVLANHDHFRITQVNGQQLASFDLDLEYHTFKGFSVNNGILTIAVRYELPEKYHTVTWVAQNQEGWEKIKNEDKKND